MSSEEKGLSRRGLLRGAAGLGVAGAAGVAAGLFIDRSTTSASATPAEMPALPDGPIMALVKHTGEVDLFVGSRLVQFRDPDLAGRIARAAR